MLRVHHGQVLYHHVHQTARHYDDFLRCGAIGLFDKGILTGEHLAILAPAIYLMGSQVQYLGRILGVIGTRAKRIPLMIAISVVNAFLAMLLMRIIL